MTKDNTINAFIKLGEFLSSFDKERMKNVNHPLEIMIKKNQVYNAWFNPMNIRQSIIAIAKNLKADNLTKWSLEISDDILPKTVAVIMAGNIPLVGFHDFLSVLISGHNIKIKLSKDDDKLLPIIVEELISIEPKLQNRISFSSRNLNNFDAIIATGSNNSKTYFNSYFSSYPNIIRSNRTSVAILDGTESKADLQSLATDIFSYFGLGCRSITKLYLPEKYDLDILFEVFYSFKDVIQNTKYANNYDYNKAIYLMGKHKIIENGFLILKEDTNIHSPVSVLFYEFYDNKDDLNNHLINMRDELQCICGKDYLKFGSAQRPKLTDYADGIDTLDFLCKL